MRAAVGRLSADEVADAPRDLACPHEDASPDTARETMRRPAGERRIPPLAKSRRRANDERHPDCADAILLLAEELGRLAADLWSEGRLDGFPPDGEGSDDDEEE